MTKEDNAYQVVSHDLFMQYSIYTRMQVATPAVSLMIFTKITLALYLINVIDRKIKIKDNDVN